MLPCTLPAVVLPVAAMTSPAAPTSKPHKRLTLERRLKNWLGSDLTTPRGRRRARLSTHLLDHAYLRKFWHNFEEIAPGVYRANQPDAQRLAYYKSLGIRAILSLRGGPVAAAPKDARCEA